MQKYNSRFKNSLNKNVFYFLLVLLSFAFCLLPFEKAHAQELSLGIEPPIIQIDTKRPASINTPITVENSSDVPVSLRIMLKAFTASDAQNGYVKYYTENTPEAKPAIFSYIQFAQNDHNIDVLKLAPKQTKVVMMHIGVPEKIDLGDYYFSVVFINVPDETDDKTTALQTAGGIATNVLLTIGPSGPTSGNIVEFSTPFFMEHGPVPFILRLKNTSDHYITPKGEILINNMFGQTIGRVDLLPVNVLSQTIRAIPDKLLSPDASKAANFVRPTTRYEAAVWPETFLLGPYTAQVTIALSNQGPVFRKTIFFFAFPWYLTLLLIILIAVAVYIGYRVKKRLN